MPSPLLKFDSYAEQESRGVHNWGAHTFKAVLTNAMPGLDLDTQLSHIAQVGATGGYVAGAGGGYQLDSVTLSRTGGVTKLTIADETITAAGGSIGPFRYIVVYNDSATNDPLCFMYDYGSPVTLAAGDSFVLDFDATNGVWTKS